MAPAPKSWAIDFDADAVLDFEDVKSKGERKAVFNVIHKLKKLGPDLPSPHMRSLKGETDLFELRPKQGASAARPIYARVASRFVLAIAPHKKALTVPSTTPARASLAPLTADNRFVIITAKG